MILFQPNITFCITCRNRTDFLKQTIFRNLEVAEKRNADFTLVNYGSEDNLNDFVKKHLKKYVQNNIIQYYYYEANEWCASKAKNVSHYMATGNVLFNLDCDNFISIELYDKLIELFTEIPDSCVKNSKNPSSNFWVGNQEYIGDGTGGRICLSRKKFLKLGGYDETLEVMGHQDNDLANRANADGSKFVILEEHCESIIHTKCFGLPITYQKWKQMNFRNETRSNQNIKSGKIIANTNFDEIKKKAKRIFL